MKAVAPPNECNGPKLPENQCPTKVGCPTKAGCPTKEPERKCSMKSVEPPKTCCATKEIQGNCSVKVETPDKCSGPMVPENKCPTKAEGPPKKCAPKEPESKCSAKATEPNNCGQSSKDCQVKLFKNLGNEQQSLEILNEKCDKKVCQIKDSIPHRRGRPRGSVVNNSVGKEN